MFKTIDLRRRLINAVRSKWGYLACGLLVLLTICVSITLPAVFMVGVMVCLLPSLIVSFWHFASALADWPWSLDAEVNQGACKLVRENVTAVLAFVWVLSIAVEISDTIRELMRATNGTVLGLMFVYPWVGLFGAISATHWTKKSAEEASEPVVDAVDVGARVAASQVPVAGDGWDGRSDTTVVSGSSRGLEGSGNAAGCSSAKSARDRRLLAAGVMIGALSCSLIVLRLRRK